MIDSELCKRLVSQFFSRNKSSSIDQICDYVIRKSPKSVDRSETRQFVVALIHLLQKSLQVSIYSDIVTFIPYKESAFIDRIDEFMYLVCGYSPRRTTYDYVEKSDNNTMSDSMRKMWTEEPEKIYRIFCFSQEEVANACKKSSRVKELYDFFTECMSFDIDEKNKTLKFAF